MNREPTFAGTPTTFSTGSPEQLASTPEPSTCRPMTPPPRQVEMTLMAPGTGSGRNVIVRVPPRPLAVVSGVNTGSGEAADGDGAVGWAGCRRPGPWVSPTNPAGK